MNHTPEPWKAVGPEGAIFGGKENRKLVVQAAYENAPRIVECVNACEKIENPETTIPELLKHLRHLVDVCEYYPPSGATGKAAETVERYVNEASAFMDKLDIQA